MGTHDSYQFRFLKQVNVRSYANAFKEAKMLP